MAVMSPAQEVGNAVSMVLPTAVLAFNAWADPNSFVTVLLVGSAMHLPVSFTYHLSVAFERYQDRLDNDMRRLDQSMQHVAGTVFSFALSGSLGYTALNLALNLRGLYYLWAKETSNDGKRWVPVLLCVLMYTAPGLPELWRGRGKHGGGRSGVCVLWVGPCGVSYGAGGLRPGPGELGKKTTDCILIN